MNDVQHHHASRRAMAAGQARFDAAEPPDPDGDDLAATLDAAIDELHELRDRLRRTDSTDEQARERVAREARDIAAYLRDASA